MESMRSRLTQGWQNGRHGGPEGKPEAGQPSGQVWATDPGCLGFRACSPLPSDRG